MGTQPTHAKCAESTRCIAWGTSPMLNSATTTNVLCPHRRSAPAGAAATPTNTRRPIEPSRAKNQTKSCCESSSDGIGHDSCSSAPARCRKPSRCPHDGGMGRLPAAAQVEDRVEDHAVDDVAGAGGQHVHDIGRDADERTGEQPAIARPSRAAHERHRREPDRQHEVGTEQQREAEQQSGEQRPTPRPALVDESPREEPAGEPEEPEPDRADPGERGEAERHEDESRQQRAPHREPAPPRASQGVDAEHHGHLLRETEEPLGQQRHAEHLERAGEGPEAPRSVEVEEVLVGDVALQHPLREDEHEALFHRRPLRAQQAAERDEEDQRHDPEGEQLASPRRGRRLGRGIRARARARATGRGGVGFRS